MKRILLRSTLALTLAATAAFAQQSNPQQPADGAQQSAPQQGHHHHQFNPQKAAQHLQKRLNLTDDQTAKIEPILADQHQKMTALHSDTSLSKDQRHQQMRTIFEQTHTQLAGVLTPDQMQQLRSMRHGRGGRQQQQDQGSAPSAS